MLELNISFIFHLFFIIIGCQIITFFFNKLYDNILDYKKKETDYLNSFNNENNLLKEKIICLEKKFNTNIQAVNNLIKDVIINENDISTKLKYTIKEYPIISTEKKTLIDNYFNSLLKKID